MPTPCRFNAVLFLTLSLLFCGYSAAEEDPFPVLTIKPGDVFANKQVFEQYLVSNGSEVGVTASGELAGIGRVEVVNSLNPDCKMFVLTHQPDGQLRLLAHTMLGENWHCQLHTTLKLDKGSLFVTIDEQKDAVGTYQFKARTHGRLRLIGLKLQLSTYNGDDDNGGMTYTDFNLVTGRMLLKRVDQTRGGPSEAHISGPACYFEDFSFGFFPCAEGMKSADGTPVDELMRP